MKRLILEDLKNWKNKIDRKPLILNGARQVGKTWVLSEFAKKYYKKCAYFVCRKNELLTQVFSEDFDIKRIIRSLKAISHVNITPHDTLIVLDEIQDIPEAIESLKYFNEQAPDYHIAVAGSLLGLSLHNNVSYPVGKVNLLNLTPMSFEEFLLASKENECIDILKSNDFSTMNSLHNKFVDLLRQYYYVGGMPEVVKHYVESQNLEKVRDIQKEILFGYEMDFSKHASKDQVQRIRQVWHSIPSQLFKENKKFIYGAIKKGARAKEFEIAIEWLVNSGLVHKVPLCTQIRPPLKIYEDLSAFKLYLTDIGLLGALVDTEPAQVLIKNDIFVEYKGGMTEQYVLQQMKSKKMQDIFYHKADNSRLEIDFLIQTAGKVIPIEVKAETNVRANSLSNLLQSNPDINAIRYSMLTYKKQNNLTCVPLYAVSCFCEK